MQATLLAHVPDTAAVAGSVSAGIQRMYTANVPTSGSRSQSCVASELRRTQTDATSYMDTWAVLNAADNKVAARSAPEL